MLRIVEHHQYYHKFDNHLDTLKNVRKGHFVDCLVQPAQPIYFRKNEIQLNKEECCLLIRIEGEKASIENSYFIGLDRIQPWNMPVIVQPKMKQIDHLEMLIEALKEPENFHHLDGLMEVRFEEDWIEVKADEILELTPFLLVQFIMAVQLLVRKGLKKDYYTVTENLSSKLKGKILVGQQIRQNVVRNKLANTVCMYQEFGLDTEANQFLKYVLHFAQAQVENFPSLKNSIMDNLRYSMGAFEQVSEKKFYALKQKETNPFFKEYNIAIELGNQILRLMDCNLSKSTSTLQKYPPHWIDMSKLFELYTFKKLREKFSSQEVKYHPKVSGQELDFIVQKGAFKAVVDAKYKPRYKSGNPSMDDARQLAGYTRLNNTYKLLGMKDSLEIIPAYFIYPSDKIQETNEDEKDVDHFDEDPKIDNKVLFGNLKVRKSTSYREMYLQEIELPMHSC